MNVRQMSLVKSVVGITAGLFGGPVATFIQSFSPEILSGMFQQTSGAIANVICNLASEHMNKFVAPVDCHQEENHDLERSIIVS